MKYKVFISEKEQQLANIRIPKNAIIIRDEHGDLTLCKDFPRNYKGKNPILHIYYWDSLNEWWEADIWQNDATRTLWALYCKGGYKKLPRLLRPQIEHEYKKVPHDTKIGNVQSPNMCDPEKRRLADHRTTDYHCCKPSVYGYYSRIGCYGKSGDSMCL